MKKIVFFLLLVITANAQVGIGTTSPQAELDITSSNDGLLIPRVSLINSTDATTVQTLTVSELVYHTGSAGLATPGYYYWDGVQWVRLQVGLASNDWTLLGNSGTNASTNFLGTTDNVDLIFRRNNIISGRLGASNTIFGSGAFATGTGNANSVVGGSSLIANTTGNTNAVLGYYNMRANTTGFSNVALGYTVLNSNTTGRDNISIGTYSSDANTTGNYNVTLGYNSLNDNSTGSSNVALGQNALSSMVNFSNNVAVGAFAGQNVAGDNNTSLGAYALRSGPAGSGNVAIGYRAGYYETGNDKLYIDNTDTSNPLIYGEFDNNILRTNGTLQVNIPGSGGYTFPVGDGVNGQVLTTNGTGVVSWQTPGVAPSSWLLGGNSGTNPTTQFLGTTDNQDLVFRTNNLERARFNSNGNLGINFAPNVVFKTIVYNDSQGAIAGLTDSPSGQGVYGATSSSNGLGVFGINTGAGVGVAGLSNNNTIVTRAGTVGITQGTIYSLLSGYDSGLAGTGRVGVYGYSLGSALTTRFAGAFVYDIDNNISTNDSNSPRAQLAGYDTTNSIYYGGYFSGGQDNVGSVPSGDTVDYTWVGTRTGGTNYKILGNGSVSTIIDGDNEQKHIMFAPEAPEILFQDYGVGQLVNGEVRIEIDPILAKNIFVDENHPLKVFVQLKGDCNGVYVTNESNTGFTVKELQGGTSNVKFSYQIVANRVDRRDLNGNILSKHQDVRLPVAPKPLKTLKNTGKKMEVVELK